MTPRRRKRIVFFRKIMIVQIYEIQTPEEAERCLALGVDRLGSVILSETDRGRSRIREVVELVRGTDAKSSLIPLFSNENKLFSVMDILRPDYVHFCEALTDEQGRPHDLRPVAERQHRFRERYPGIGIVRTLPVPEAGRLPGFPALEIAAALEDSSDGFLIDTWLGRDPVEGFVGITGRLPDLDRAAKIVRASRIPVILAGGLSPENVYESMRRVRPAGADSCTLTNALDREGNPIRFKKDFDKVAAFVSEVRRAEKDFDGPSSARF